MKIVIENINPERNITGDVELSVSEDGAIELVLVSDDEDAEYSGYVAHVDADELLQAVAALTQ